MTPPPQITRRKFLAGAAVAGAAGAAGLAVARGPLRALEGPGTAGRLSAPGDASLVLLTLYGGNDGLNTVIPYEDGNYLGQRASIGYQPDEVLPLGDGLALHPSLKGVKGLWDARHVAIVRGVGYPDPSFSHFRSMDIWQSAVPDTDVSTGWVGRWLDGTGHDPLRALALGTNLPLAFSGAKVQAAALPSSTFGLPGPAAQRSTYAALEDAAGRTAAMPAAVATAGSDLLTVQHALGEILGTKPAAAGAGNVGNGPSATGDELSAQLAVVSKLIKAGAPTKVYGASLGGFDTHAGEKETQAALLGELDHALTTFLNDLRGDPRGGKTVVVVYSEFGRRVAPNASGGTDHGSAAPVFVVGYPVKGGFYGEEPSLSNLDMGNLRFTTDFRSVYATVLEGVVGADPKQVLGSSWPPIQLL